MTPADRAFYAEEARAYRGPWNIPLSADTASVLTQRLLDAVGESAVDIRVRTGTRWHRTYWDRIEYAANEITPQVVVHEVAHVIQFREAGDHGVDHDADAWNLVALLACILEEIL